MARDLSVIVKKMIIYLQDVFGVSSQISIYTIIT